MRMLESKGSQMALSVMSPALLSHESYASIPIAFCLKISCKPKCLVEGPAHSNSTLPLGVVAGSSSFAIGITRGADCISVAIVGGGVGTADGKPKSWHR